MLIHISYRRDIGVLVFYAIAKAQIGLNSPEKIDFTDESDFRQTLQIVVQQDRLTKAYYSCE
jgi:hypothetical protein